MVAIKSLTQLSLSRSASQNSTPRSMTSSPSPTTVQPTVPSRLTSNEDYYLSDEQLVIHRPTPRTKSASSMAPKSDLNITYTTPPNVQLSWGNSNDEPHVVAPLPAKPSSLVPLTRRPHHTMVMAPAPTVACGHTIQPTPHTSGAHRPLLSTLLSVSTKASPNISRASSPKEVAHVGPSPLTQDAKMPLQQLEASYVSKVGTRMRDLVNKVFPSAVENGLACNGRSAPKPTVASSFSEALRHELTVASRDSYILRALLRTAIIPALTIYVGRLDPLLVPIASNPSLLFVPKNAKEVDGSLPLELRYNIEVVKSAWVVRNCVDEICAGVGWEGEVPKVLLDGLGPFGSKLDAIIQRFMGPYLMEIKSQVMSRISRFRLSDPNGLQSSLKVLPLALGRASGVGVLSSSWGSPAHTPDHLSELTSILEGVRRLLMVKLACGPESKKWMVSVASQAVWKGMLAFAARPAVPSYGQPPLQLPTVHHDSAYLGLRGARHILRGVKRSPSPPLTPEYVIYNELALEVKAFSVTINQFVKDIAGLGQNDNAGASLTPNSLDCVFCTHGFLVNTGDDGDLVRDAMNEALEALSAFQLILLALLHPAKLYNCLEASVANNGLSLNNHDRGHIPGTSICLTLTRALQELPPLILSHAIGSRISKRSGFRLPHEIWGESWSEYESELKGFVAAESWTPEIGTEMMREIKRIVKHDKGDDTGLTGQDKEMMGLLEYVCKFQIGI
ncbi:uncharacterized protein MELLADRAFT_76219 [Melampsora larici-populina 98AG31]|uniref:Uncharacterized protein n=1 Tax=Melampsora larici-populina (strain 98AG31 / pathotype 3-4-7) TaxID=747676 RepID=F4R339_MELLP|nr:uncharacterized protein MELLADRAFT_76219 [Melampsora larici-populina 98AG31]EGG12561.1 hypothetical protein MELLADRAFT_76219 [Melampsora larici-populina 98AG31]